MLYLVFSFKGLQKGSLKEQLEEFAKQIGSTFYQGPSIIPQMHCRDAFEDLTQAISKVSKEKKIVLFLMNSSGW